MHYDAMPYGWWEQKWRARNPWPTSLRDPKNYVLTIAEMKEYATVLAQMKEEINQHEQQVRATVQALEKGTWRSWTSTHEPRLVSLAHVLEFLIVHAKAKLALMQFLVKASGARVPQPTKGE